MLWTLVCGDGGGVSFLRSVLGGRAGGPSSLSADAILSGSGARTCCEREFEVRIALQIVRKSQDTILRASDNQFGIRHDLRARLGGLAPQPKFLSSEAHCYRGTLAQAQHFGPAGKVWPGPFFCHSFAALMSADGVACPPTTLQSGPTVTPTSLSALLASTSATSTPGVRGKSSRLSGQVVFDRRSVRPGRSAGERIKRKSCVVDAFDAAPSDDGCSEVDASQLVVQLEAAMAAIEFVLDALTEPDSDAGSDADCGLDALAMVAEDEEEPVRKST